MRHSYCPISSKLQSSCARFSSIVVLVVAGRRRLVYLGGAAAGEPIADNVRAAAPGLDDAAHRARAAAEGSFAARLPFCCCTTSRVWQPEGGRVQVRAAGERPGSAAAASCAAMSTRARCQVPEGYNIYDIAAVVEQAGLGPAADFVTAAKGDLFLMQATSIPMRKSLEGYLFPDTYQFTRIDTRARDRRRRWCIASARRRRRSDCWARPTSTDRDHGLDCGKGDCRSRGAAAGGQRVLQPARPGTWLLGADPSVVYAALLAGRYRGTIYQSDLQFDSPYNTYKYAGLAAGPDRQSRSSVAAGGHASGANGLPVFCQRQQRPSPLFAHRGGARPQRGGLPSSGSRSRSEDSRKTAVSAGQVALPAADGDILRLYLQIRLLPRPMKVSRLLLLGVVALAAGCSPGVSSAPARSRSAPARPSCRRPPG